MDLRGARVVITGASRGVGRRLATDFAGAGARLALVARDEAALKALAAELGGTAHPADLSDPDDVRGLIARIEGDGGPVDVLVNNAGIEVAKGFMTYDEGDAERLFRVNLLAPVELCRQAVPGMVARRRGHIVSVSSLSAVAPFAGLVAYSSSKAGLSQFHSGLRLELRGTGVGTTLVQMGLVPDTDMGGRVDSYEPTAASFRRFYRLGLLTDVPTATVSAATVDAVARNRRHVRLPRRAAPFALLTEAPRRLTELLLTGVKPRP
jgi:short-subunit dehydrogenase